MVTATKRIEQLAYQIQTPHHQNISDVTTDLGGSDRGPSPHDYLEIALAGCTAITLQMFAKRKNMSLDEVNVSVESSSQRAPYHFVRRIELKGTLSETERQQLLTVADKCPVHKLLSAGAQITTEVG